MDPVTSESTFLDSVEIVEGKDPGKISDPCAYDTNGYISSLYTEEKDKKKLTINIKNPIFVGDEEGEKIVLNFDSALEILDAVRKVYGANKCQVRDEISFSYLFFFVSDGSNSV